MLRVRFMVPLDLPAVAAIEEAACKRPWSKRRLMAVMSEHRVLGLVATIPGGKIVGYMFYELTPQSLQIRSLVVAPDYQRRGVGTFLMQHVQRSISRRRRTLTNIQVTDDNTGAHHFLKSLGFRAFDVVRGDDRDVYLFEWRAPVAQPWMPVDCGNQVP